MTAATVLEGLPELRPPDGRNLVDHADEDLGRGHLSHSSLNAQLSCHQLYAYQYVDQIEPAAKRSPQRMGGAFAKALEAGDPEVGVRAVVDAAVIRDQRDEDNTRIEAMIVGSAATAYLDRYGQTQPDEREFGYRVQLRNPWTGSYSRTFDLLGYADQLIDQGDRWEMVEDKLVGTISDVQVRRLPLDRQLALGCYGVWRSTCKPVGSVRYRFTRKPSIKQRKGESLEQFLERIAADYEERPDFYLVEESLVRSNDDLARTEAELWEWAEQRRKAEKRQLYPRNSSHCHDYGGCAFLPLCVGDPDASSLYRPKSKNDRQAVSK